jgi:hypothetical protein
VDGDTRTIRTIQPPHEDVVRTDTLVWHPAGTAEPLTLDIPSVFRAALGA